MMTLVSLWMRIDMALVRASRAELARPVGKGQLARSPAAPSRRAGGVACGAAARILRTRIPRHAHALEAPHGRRLDPARCAAATERRGADRAFPRRDDDEDLHETERRPAQKAAHPGAVPGDPARKHRARVPQ